MKVWKTSSAYHLELNTIAGWTLEQVLASSRVDKVQLSTPVAFEGTPGSTMSYGVSGGVQAAIREEIAQVHEPVFLLSKEQEVVAREAALSAELRALHETMQPLELRHSNDTRDIEDLTKQIESLKTVNHRLEIQYMNELTLKRDALADLTKIKTAIGTVRYDEILAD